jgi:dipeptide/tripeptide permease
MEDSVSAGPAAPEKRACFTVALGIVLVLVGTPMLVCPGPGMAVVAAGIGMIGVGLGFKRKAEE